MCSCIIEGMRELWLPLQAGKAGGRGGLGGVGRPGGMLDAVSAACPVADLNTSGNLYSLFMKTFYNNLCQQDHTLHIPWALRSGMELNDHIVAAIGLLTNPDSVQLLLTACLPS